MFYIVYKTTNKINGKFYVGTHKTKNLDDMYLGSGKLLKRAIEKYGIEFFEREILFIFDNPLQMFAKEAEIVTDDFLSENNTYNLKLGGYGGFDFCNKPESMTEKRLSSLWHGNTISHTKESRLKAARTRKERGFKPPGFAGRTHSSVSKEKQSVAASQRVGPRNSQFGTMWITNGSENKKIKSSDVIPTNWKKGRV